MAHNSPEGNNLPDMTVREFQQLIRDRFYETDSARGTPKTFMWFTEEVGELATSLMSDDREEQEGEFADVMGWLCTLANINDIDLNKALRDKYITNIKEGFK